MGWIKQCDHVKIFTGELTPEMNAQMALDKAEHDVQWAAEERKALIVQRSMDNAERELIEENVIE